jgi:hypothetical protein
MPSPHTSPPSGFKRSQGQKEKEKREQHKVNDVFGLNNTSDKIVKVLKERDMVEHLCHERRYRGFVPIDKPEAKDNPRGYQCSHNLILGKGAHHNAAGDKGSAEEK